MEFVDDAGVCETITANIEENLEKQLVRLSERIDLWSHVHPVCFVYSESTPISIKNLIREKCRGLNRKEISFDRIPEIRGIEFQEEFVFISKEYWDQINTPRKNMLESDWEAVLLFHVLLSRPKDGLFIYIYNL